MEVVKKFVFIKKGFCYLVSFHFFLYLCSLKGICGIVKKWCCEPMYGKKDKYKNSMKTFLKYLGAILVLCGVVCLAVYAFVLPSNWLLACAMVLEVVGILSYIIINKHITE